MQGDNVLIIKRKVKYPRIELKTGVPMLILPQNSNFCADEILQKHREWINQKLEFIKKIEEKYKNQKIYTRSNNDFIKLVTNLIDESAIVLGKKPSKIIFRYMKTKWASCSQQGKITFNLMLKYLPPRLIRYVVFHEMVHLLVPNHKQNFWDIIKKQFKNSNQYEEQLFGYWFLLQNQELN
ncbi:MAG: M48 family metallopeptidase [Candidatus Pacebacteria bacterium]|nr:M48 family metallopeptidase [Candidatus Paceibacterota bacterium]